MKHKALFTLIPDEDLRANVRAYFEQEIQAWRKKYEETEQILAQTVETLHGEVRENLRLKDELKKYSSANFYNTATLGGYIYEAIVDANTVIAPVIALYASSEFHRITGYTLEEINEKGWQYFIHPDDLPKFQVSANEAMQERQAHEYRLRTKDGKTIWIRDFSQPIFDEEGRYIKHIGVSYDITAEKEAQLDLKRNQQLLQNLLQVLPVGVCLSDADGYFKLVNPALCDMLGYRKEDLIGNSFLMDIPKEYQDLAREMHQLFMGGDSLISSSELPIQRSDGKVIWVSITTRKFQHEDGKWYRISAVKDITKQRKREVQMQELIDLLAQTESLAHIGSGEFDYRTNCFTKWSDEMFRIYERSIELGPPSNEELVSVALNQEAYKRLMEFNNHLKMTGGQGEIEIPITTFKGSQKIIRIKAMVIDENAVPVKSIGLTQDVTKERLLEKQKEELQAQLLQAQKLEAIGTLTGGIAHEFNNILAGMRGNVQLLEMKLGDDQRVSKYINRLLELNRRAASIVSQMLGFARKGKYELKAVSLKASIDNVLKILIPATDRRIRFHIDTAAQTLMIQADPVQIEQVILNLAKNAVDAIEPLLGTVREQGHITLRLSYEPIAERFRAKVPNAESSPMVMLEVRDNGMGVSEDHQSKIFEPFFTTKPPGKGTGLGLPMVYGIVQNHQGYVFMESQEGQGSSFYLYLPAFKKSEKVKGEQVVDSKINLSNIHVLIIDDEVSMQETLGEYLSAHCATVEMAENGLKGIEKFRALKKENAVVVLDLNLPDTNGEKVLEELLMIDPKAKVIIGTGYLESEQANRLKQKGAIDVITKPYMLDDVAHTIESIVKKNN